MGVNLPLTHKIRTYSTQHTTGTCVSDIKCPILTNNEFF